MDLEPEIPAPPPPAPPIAPVAAGVAAGAVAVFWPTAAGEMKSSLARLQEDFAKQEARNNPTAKHIMAGRINDPRYPANMWGKYQHVHRSLGGEDIVIHFWRNVMTGLEEGFKVK